MRKYIVVMMVFVVMSLLVSACADSGKNSEPGPVPGDAVGVDIVVEQTPCATNDECKSAYYVCRFVWDGVQADQTLKTCQLGCDLVVVDGVIQFDSCSRFGDRLSCVEQEGELEDGTPVIYSGCASDGSAVDGDEVVDGDEIVDGDEVEDEDRPECYDNLDCAVGYYCDSTGNCVKESEPECDDDSDCADGYYCERGNCLPEQEQPDPINVECCYHFGQHFGQVSYDIEGDADWGASHDIQMSDNCWGTEVDRNRVVVNTKGTGSREHPVWFWIDLTVQQHGGHLDLADWLGDSLRPTPESVWPRLATSSYDDWIKPVGGENATFECRIDSVPALVYDTFDTGCFQNTSGCGWQIWPDPSAEPVE